MSKTPGAARRVVVKLWSEEKRFGSCARIIPKSALEKNQKLLRLWGDGSEYKL